MGGYGSTSGRHASIVGEDLSLYPSPPAPECAKDIELLLSDFFVEMTTENHINYVK
ncbi:hypothetical protein J6590_026761 [Homalodisca vitripennis]|nr:hypothetical protein J6590_026761 [Homalodisca vitripennis]